MSRWTRAIVFAAVLIFHAVLLVSVSITTRAKQEREDTTVFKMVDVSEIVPQEEPEVEEEVRQLPPAPADGIAEDILEVPEPVETVVATPQRREEVDYLPQHRISVAPRVPTDAILAAIEYPPLANRQGIEGVVYLELFIDADGIIQQIVILREPGYGLGEAAVAAFEGVRCTPAEANGVPVPVRYRFPVRFQLE